jgi:hypothetical protein
MSEKSPMLTLAGNGIGGIVGGPGPAGLCSIGTGAGMNVRIAASESFW